MPAAEAAVESDSYPWLVKHFPISPPCLRPACQTVGPKKSISHNDLTHRLGSLIRIDKGIRKSYETNPNNTQELKRLMARLQLAFTLLFFPPPGQRESRELSCLTDRLKGKDGRLRLTLLGKRIISCLSGQTNMLLEMHQLSILLLQLLATITQHVDSCFKLQLNQLSNWLQRLNLGGNNSTFRLA